MQKSGFIAIIGRPNSGKSTLLNAVLGTQVSIVTPKAQTTREKVLGIHSDQRGQIVFVDTPGIHRAREGGINAFMVAQAAEALEAPDLIWYIVDPRSGLEHERPVLDMIAKSQAPVILLMNKSDQSVAAAEALAQSLEAELARLALRFKGLRFISALKGRGVKELLAESWGVLPEGPLYYPDVDQISDRPVKFFVAEKVREQLYLQLGDELPYACAVEIVSYNERAKPVRIEATIHVERDSQKGMVIGKGGLKIKEIGQAARKQIEEFIGEQVFLGLQVKVLKDWSRDADALKRMGYDIPARKDRHK